MDNTEIRRFVLDEFRSCKRHRYNYPSKGEPRVWPLATADARRFINSYAFMHFLETAGQQVIHAR